MTMNFPHFRCFLRIISLKLNFFQNLYHALVYIFCTNGILKLYTQNKLSFLRQLVFCSPWRIKLTALSESSYRFLHSITSYVY